MNSNRKTKGILVCVLAVASMLPTVARDAKADFVFGIPTNLGPTVNTPSYDSDICISNDGLSLYFTSDRPGGSGSYDIWVTTRETAQDLWGEPVNLGPTVNSGVWEHTPFISADGLTLFFSSSRSGGFGMVDIWFTTRTSVSDPWSTPENLGSTVNTSAADAAVNISFDGLSLLFNSTRSGGYGGQDLLVSTRPTASDPWAEPVNLGPTVNSSAWDYTPALSPDGRLLIFGSNRSGGLGSDDLWLTTRETIVDAWGEPVNLGPAVNSSAGEGGANLSVDGSTLYFGSNRPGGSGQVDIWQAPIIPIVDFNGDGSVDLVDLVMLIDVWGTDDTLCDIGPMPWGDGTVDIEDLKVFMTHWEKQNGPVLP